MANDKIDIPNFFNTPEYKERQNQLRAVNNSNQTHGEGRQISNNSSIKMKYVNSERINRLSRKKKIQKIANKVKLIVVLGCLVIIFSVGSKIYNKITTPQHEYVVPTGYTEMYSREIVGYDGNVSDIAEKYYNNDDGYEIAYGTFNNYVNAIIELNNLNYKGTVQPYQQLNIPALVDENNEYLIQISAIQAQIDEYTTDNIEKPFWIKNYKVQFGDTLLGLSGLASNGTTNETYRIKGLIIDKNKLSSEYLYEGQSLEIVNPELGLLKSQIEDLKNEFYESLKGNENTK